MSRVDVQRVKRVMRGRFGGPLRLGYGATARAQLAVVRRADRRQFGPPTADERDELAQRVTMVVKTFERPAILRRCLASARTVFDGRILVVDDSRNPVAGLGDGIEVVRLPFNSGTAKGRNAGLDRVDTEFVYVADDDIVFTHASDLVACMNFLDDHPEADLIAPLLVDLPRGPVPRPRGAEALFPGADQPEVPYGSLIGGQPVVAKVANVFLARTEAIRRVRWDERLRMVEHRDFFSRAAGRIVSVQADGVRAYHVRSLFDPAYNRFRDDIAADLRTLSEIWAPRSED